MGMIQWNESLSVNVAEIDAQHQKLIGLINDLNAAMLRGKGRDVLGSILTGLVDYAETHFQTEERYFLRFGYPEAGPHQKAHADFVAKVIDFQNGFAADRAGLFVDVLLFSSDWPAAAHSNCRQEIRSLLHANGLRVLTAQDCRECITSPDARLGSNRRSTAADALVGQHVFGGL